MAILYDIEVCTIFEPHSRRRIQTASSHCGCRCWARKLEKALSEFRERRRKKKPLWRCNILSPVFNHVVLLCYFVDISHWNGIIPNKCPRQVSHEWPSPQWLRGGQVPAWSLVNDAIMDGGPCSNYRLQLQSRWGTAREKKLRRWEDLFYGCVP